MRAGAGEAREEARRTAERSPWPQRVARAGLAGRGAMHLLVGYLALRILAGDGQKHADQKGALSTVAQQPFGRVAVAALAVALVAYALWRLFDALVDPEDDSGWKRAANGARGALYLGLAAVAASFVVGGAGDSSSSDEQQDVTARVLGWPFGRFVVGAVGVGLLALAAYNAWQSASRRFEDRLKEYELDRGQRRLLVALGVVGFAGRAAAFALAGFFVVHAAVTFDAREGVGLDAALREVAGAPWGPAALAAVGLGLVAYGVFEIAQARYRRVYE